MMQRCPGCFCDGDHENANDALRAELAAARADARQMAMALGAIVGAFDSVCFGAGERFHMTTDLLDDARRALRHHEENKR